MHGEAGQLLRLFFMRLEFLLDLSLGSKEQKVKPGTGSLKWISRFWPSSVAF
jgi:hypothetical protein